MKKFLTITLVVIAFLAIIGLLGGPTQADYDALVTENEQLKAELVRYQTTPDKLYKDVPTLVANKNIDSLTVVCDALYKYHPTSKEYTNTKSALDKLVAEKEAAERAEREKRMKAVKKLTSKYDDVSGITWYYNPHFVHYNDSNRTSLYMGKQKDGRPWLRLRMSYAGDNWIFFENAYLSYDGNTFEILFNEYNDKKTEIGSGRVWEWIDVSVTNETLAFLKEMVKGKTLKMRLSGKYSETRTLSYSEIEGLKDVLLAYDVLLNGE